MTNNYITVEDFLTAQFVNESYPRVNSDRITSQVKIQKPIQIGQYIKK